MNNYRSGQVFYIGGRIVVARSSGVYFFRPDTGDADAAVTISDLHSLCVPSSQGIGPTGWVVRETLVIYDVDCVYVFDGVTARAARVLGGIGGKPVWSGGRVVVSNLQGAILGLDPATGTIAWSAPPPPTVNSNSNTDTVESASGGTSTVYTLSGGNCIVANYGPTGQELWQACFPNALDFGYYDPVTAPLVVNETFLAVNGGNGIVGIDASLNADNSNRVRWNTMITDNAQNDQYSFACSPCPLEHAAHAILAPELFEHVRAAQLQRRDRRVVSERRSRGCRRVQRRVAVAVHAAAELV